MFRQIFEHVKYTLIHKFYVLIECWKYGLIWQGIVHDLDKFLPLALVGYGENFFNPDGTRKVIHDKSGHYNQAEQKSDKFKMAWLRHARLNKHHWQYWVLATEKGESCFMIPKKYVLEMICDWKGAGKALKSTNSKEWWKANQNKMRFHPVTKRQINFLINKNKE